MTSFTPDPLATRYHFEVVNGKDLSVAIHNKGHKAPDVSGALCINLTK
jgi:hypothetical protein